MQNISFSDSGYVIKPPQSSSAIYRAPPLTGHPQISLLYLDSPFNLASFKSLINFNDFLHSLNRESGHASHAFTI